MNDQSQMMVHSQILQNHQNYVVWPPYPPENTHVFSHPHVFNPNLPGRVNWKGNKIEKRKEFRRNELPGSGSGHGYKLGISNDSQPLAANRSGSKPRRFHHQKKKFAVGGGGGRLVVPFAPRNTTSFIIRAKKSGGIASLVSPCPVTPAILPTPMLSPSKEVVVEMAKEEWGVDGYGSMKGLIRLRSEKGDSDEDSDDIPDNYNEREEVEKRLDHDLISRFEMIYPSSGDEQNLENRVDEQDTQIAHLEEENLTLKERIFLMERELGELRRRLVTLETDGIAAFRRNDRQPEDLPDNLSGDVYSEKSVGNDHHDDGEGNGGCD